ncbi:MAG: hypothetical protein ACRCSQ_03365 [Bacteroidales bacterium]
MDKYNVVKEWKEQFPILSRYTPSTLYMKVDVILIGLRIERVLLGTYRVILEGMPLWKIDKIERNLPIFHIELKSEKKRSFSIEYERHKLLFQRAAACAKIQFDPILKKNILLSDLNRVFKKSFILNANKHYLFELAQYFEFKLALALFYNDVDLMNKTKKEIEKAVKIWDPNYFYNLFNMSLDEWKNDLYKSFENREDFLEKVKYNIENNKKITALKEGHFILKEEGRSETGSSRLISLFKRLFT